MNFKNLIFFEKCNILKMCKQINRKENFNCLVFFKSDRPVCNDLNDNFIKKNYPQNHFFFFKNVDICIFNPKNFEVKDNCSKVLLNVCL